jgi:hypothetical protein
VAGLNCGKESKQLAALNGVQKPMNHSPVRRVEFNPNLVTIGSLREVVARAGNDGRHQYRAFNLMDAG